MRSSSLRGQRCLTLKRGHYNNYQQNGVNWNKLFSDYETVCEKMTFIEYLVQFGRGINEQTAYWRRRKWIKAGKPAPVPPPIQSKRRGRRTAAASQPVGCGDGRGKY